MAHKEDIVRCASCNTEYCRMCEHKCPKCGSIYYLK
jgi:hypothetical protein